MRKIHSLAITLFAIALFSMQLAAQVAAPVKIGFIETEAFYDEKLGITRLVAASKQLDKEFEVRIKALQADNTKLQTLSTEIAELQKQRVPDLIAIERKRDEGTRLQREVSYRKTELESDINKRRDVLIGPISQDIGKGIDEFAKKQGYGVILDVSKMVESGFILSMSQPANVTKEFIAFYNTRPTPAAKP